MLIVWSFCDPADYSPRMLTRLLSWLQLTVGDADERVADYVVGGLADEELEGEVLFGSLLLLVQAGVLIAVEGVAAEAGGGFLRVLHGEESLIGVVAFDGDAEFELAVFTEYLRVVVDVVVDPRVQGRYG